MFVREMNKHISNRGVHPSSQKCNFKIPSQFPTLPVITADAPQVCSKVIYVDVNTNSCVSFQKLYAVVFTFLAVASDK